MTDLHIGIIGSGGRGTLARHAHKPGQGARIMACCDTRPEQFARDREFFGNDIFTTDDCHVLLARELDAVFVTTPDFLHEEHAVAALEAGKAVYLEKPIAITIEGADRILRTAAERKGLLYLGHNMRHMDFVLKMKELIDSGRIGEVKACWCRHFVGHGGDFYFKDWHADRRNTTSLLLQKAAHDIDVMHWLCGGYARRVNAMGGLTLYGRITDRRQEGDPENAHCDPNNWPPLSQTGLNPIVDVEDLSMLHMELNNGVLASYAQCHYTPDYWRNYTVIGTEGRIENFGDTQSNAVIKLWNTRTDYNADGDEVFPCGGKAEMHGGADPRIVNEFLDCVRGEGTPSTSPVAARYSVAAGCCATASLRNKGVPIDVPELDADVAAYFG
jgi:predicted dehydrogenase